MTQTFISLDSVSYTLPNGRALFSELTETFDTTPTGLVGRNGMGKTLLARLMAGEIAPLTGRSCCFWMNPATILTCPRYKHWRVC